MKIFKEFSESKSITAVSTIVTVVAVGAAAAYLFVNFLLTGSITSLALSITSAIMTCRELTFKE
jgi:hypothetical protein